MLSTFYNALCPEGQRLSYTTAISRGPKDKLAQLKNYGVSVDELLGLLEQNQDKLHGFITQGGVIEGGEYVREPKQNNKLAQSKVKGLVFDLDLVKDGDTAAQAAQKYESLDEIKDSIGQGVADGVIAKPNYLVASGSGGVHIWYILDESISLPAWQQLRLSVAQSMKAGGFRFDVGVSTQAHSLIRAPGSMNLKSHVMSPCRLYCTNEPFYSPDQLRESFASKTSASKRISVFDGPTDVPAHLQSQASLLDDVEIDAFEPLGVYSEEALSGCRFAKHAMTDTSNLIYDQYLALASISRHIENGRSLIHEGSKDHPRYDPEMTDHLIGKLGGSGIGHDGPVSCMMLVSSVGKLDDGSCFDNPRCRRCPAKSKAIEGAAYPVLQIKKANESLLAREETKSLEVATGQLLPEGYGLHPKLNNYLARTVWDPKAGEEVAVPVTDRMWWISKIYQTEVGTNSYVIERKSTPVTAIAPATALNDSKRLMDSLSEAAIAVKHKPYCVEYFQQLAAQELEIVTTRQQMGWKKGKVFVNYNEQWSKGKDAVFTEETICEPDQQQFLDENAGTNGDLAGWRAAVEPAFAPGAEPMLFAIFYALGSILIHPCGLRGDVGLYSLHSPTSGTGKTTCLKVVSSLFGQPVRGHNGYGDTDLAIRARLGFLNHLPACIDELTTFESERLRDLVYAIVQGAGKQARKQDGSARPAQNWANSVVTTTNESFWSALQHSKKAVIDRVFEVYLKTPILNKEDADGMVEQLSDHHGVAGPAFAMHLQGYHFTNLRQIFLGVRKKLDIKTKSNDNRFTVNAMSLAMTAMSLCRGIPEMGVEIEHIRNLAAWMRNQGVSAADKRANISRDGILNPTDLLLYVKPGIREMNGQALNVSFETAPDQFVWQDEEFLYVRRSTLSKWLHDSKSPVDWNSIFSDWVHRGFVEPKTKRVRVTDTAGVATQPTCFAIRRSAFK